MAASALAPTWPTEDAFYSGDTRRPDSPELDLGHHWLMESWQPPWTLTWLRATGELALIGDDPDAEYKVELVGWFPDERALRKALDGKWLAINQGAPRGVYALRKRVHQHGVPGGQVTEQHRRQAYAHAAGARGGGAQSLF